MYLKFVLSMCARANILGLYILYTYIYSNNVYIYTIILNFKKWYVHKKKNTKMFTKNYLLNNNYFLSIGYRIIQVDIVLLIIWLKPHRQKKYIYVCIYISFFCYTLYSRNFAQKHVVYTY